MFRILARIVHFTLVAWFLTAGLGLVILSTTPVPQPFLLIALGLAFISGAAGALLADPFRGEED